MPDSPLASPLGLSASPLGPAPAAPAQPAQSTAPDLTNFNAASQAMKMNPQEQALYQMHLQNLHGSGGVDNPDGSRSTLYQITVQFGDKTLVLPTVWGGKILPPDQAIQMAKQYGLDKFFCTVATRKLKIVTTRCTTIWSRSHRRVIWKSRGQVMPGNQIPMPGGEQRDQTKFIVFENFEKMNTQSVRQSLSEKAIGVAGEPAADFW